MLARVAHLAVSMIVLIIVAGILLIMLKANPSNSTASQVHQWARSLTVRSTACSASTTPHVAIAVNWGTAAVVYLFIGGLITQLRRTRP